MKKEIPRAWSFVIVAAVYVLAAGAGVGIYVLLPLPVWAALLIADVGATAVTFLFSLI